MLSVKPHEDPDLSVCLMRSNSEKSSDKELERLF